MKIYAYVTTETCQPTTAAKCGEKIGHDQVPVSRHGDYTTWCMGKRETLAVIHDQRTPAYRWRCASAVARLIGWTR